MWSIPTRPYNGPHFAAYPIDLPLRCIAAGCKPGGTVLDPFAGSGTTGLAAIQLDRRFTGIDLSPDFARLAAGRLAQAVADKDGGRAMNAASSTEITTRNDIARDIIAGFAAVTPTLAGVFRLIDTALADLPAVLADLGRARAELEAVRLDRANLLAAIRATLAADAEGERDPLGYLRDELDSTDAPATHEAAGMSTYRQIRRQTRRARRAGLQPIVVIDSPLPVPVACSWPGSRGGTAPRSRPPPRRARSSRRAGGSTTGTRPGGRACSPSPTWPRPRCSASARARPAPARRTGLRGRRRARGGRAGSRSPRCSARSRRRCRKSSASARSCSRFPGGRTGAAAPGHECSAPLAAWPDIAKAIGLPGSKIQSASVDLWGWRARVRLARGQTIADVTARIPAIESALGTYRGAVRVYPTGDGKANRCELRVLDTDPHAEAIPWPGPSARSITATRRPRPVRGRRAVPRVVPAPARPVRRHDRVGQERRAQRPHGHPRRLRRRGHLGHRPQERHGTAAPGRRASTGSPPRPSEAAALLADAVAILQARAAHLAATGQRVWEPSPDMPALVIIVDEYAELADEAPDGHERHRLHRPARPRGRGNPRRRDPAADPEGHGAGRGPLADGHPDLLPRPRAQRRRPGPRPGHAQRRMARPHPQRARQVPRLRTRAHHAQARPRLPGHR